MLRILKGWLYIDGISMNKIATYHTLQRISIYAAKPMHLLTKIHNGLQVSFAYMKLPCELVPVHD